MTADESRSLAGLQGILQQLPASGPSGFEGLVASCLAALTGSTFRLAKSGLQFGRDASTLPDPFAIAMEAKRYRDGIRLEDVAGKAVVFDSAMGREIDLWVLAATSEVGEAVVRELHKILGEYGVELLTLDWSPTRLPELAVLIAAEPVAAVAWLVANAPSVEPARLEEALLTVARCAGFIEQRDRLSERLRAAHVGIGTLAAVASSWLRERLRDPAACQRTFGQFVSVANPEHPAQPRETPILALEAVMDQFAADQVILVHGEEGVGKTWVVAQWWSARADPPILLFVSGRRVDLLDARDPMESLARLLADQHPSVDPHGWKRRLARWRAGGAEGALRFVLVLDGINEHQHRVDWADLIRAHVPLLEELGGGVVVTCRTGFWQQEVAPRLRGSAVVVPIEVHGYTDLELAAELASAGADVADLPQHVRDFVRNPRVCAVAKFLLSALAVQPGELTIERLLLEYWRSRLAERGNLVHHNVTDFENVLRAHARGWLDRGGSEFDRDSWASYSGAARRKGLEAVIDDLTEIQEGRFLTITSENTYGFRAEALPYALGLLITAELRDVVRRTDEPNDAAADEALARVLDPVRGFDRISDIVAAAIGIAGWNENTPAVVSRALLRAWCSLQNTTDASDASVLRHAAARVDAVLDVAEQPGRALPPGFQSSALVRLLLDARDVPDFAAGLMRRIPRWLGTWSFDDRFRPNDKGAERRRADRGARIRARLAALTEAEREYLQTSTVQLPTPPEIGLQRLSALLLAGRPLAPYTSGIMAWGFAQAVAGSIHNGGEELAWVIRLNRIDWREATDAVRDLLAGFDLEPPTTRRAAAYVLRLLGDDDSEQRADELNPLQVGPSRNMAQMYSDVDPRDPEAPPPTDLTRARRTVAQMHPDQIWTSLGQTSEQHELGFAIPPLARFDPQTIVSGLNSIVATVRNRSGMPLRQAAFRLPALSVILGSESLASVRERLDSLLVQPEDASPDDMHWILFNLTATLLPHLSATEQMNCLQILPGDMPAFTALGDGLSPVDAGMLERRLVEATSRGDERELFWLLFHATFSLSDPNDRVRATVVRLFIERSDLLGSLAASYVYQTDDRDLGNAVVDECLRSKCPDTREHRRALAQAVVRCARTDAVHLVHHEFIGYVAQALGDDALFLLREYVDRTVKRALCRDEPAMRDGVELRLEVSEDGLDRLRWGDERQESDSEEMLRDFTSPEWLRRSQERQRRLREAVDVFDRELAAADAEYLVWPPPLLSLKALAGRAPEQFRVWSIWILETSDRKRLSQIRNLGLAIASAYGHSDPAIAAAVFRKLASIPSVGGISIDGVDLYTYALISAGNGAEIDILRRAAFEQAQDDRTIAALVVAAERHAPAWLQEYIRALFEGSTLADHALAVTIEGFRVGRFGGAASSWTERSGGFLGTVRDAARDSSRRSEWCQHWVRSAQDAEDPIDFWRFSILAKATIDSRNLAEATTALRAGIWARFANPITDNFEKAAEEIAKQQERTLFGGLAPDSELRAALFAS